MSNSGTAYELHGSQGKPVIALVHGLGLTRNTWEDHIPAYTQNYRVLNYDLYGHGESTKTPEHVSLAVFSEQLRQLMDELEIQSAAIAGFSLGGMINRRFAMDYPERVSALAILNSPHERTPEAQKLVEKRARQAEKGGPATTLDAAIDRWFTQEFRDGQPQTIRKIRKWILANNPDEYAKCRLLLATGVIELIRPRQPITHPAIVITCENDIGSTPEMSQAISSEIEGSQMLVLPDLKHLGLIEKPELFTNPVLAFLDALHKNNGFNI